MASPHICVFPEIFLGDEKALLPCECGEIPYDAMTSLQRDVQELTTAVLQLEPHRTLYHWSPASRRKQIIRHGLRPSSRSVTASKSYSVICLADSPSWAWALSGQSSWTPVGEWDLWQTYLDRLVDPVVLPASDRPSGIYEVRTQSRIYKRDLWYVGSRTKEN